METSKLRTGEIVAAVGALVLLIALLFLDWYSFGVDVEIPFGGGDISADFGAWDGEGFLGSIFNIIIFVAAAVGIGQAVVKLTSTKVSLPVALSALTAAGGVAAVVMVVLRILIKPDTGPDFSGVPGISTDLAFGIFVALAGAIVLAVGGWMSMKDEGTSFSEAREQIGAKMSAETPSAPPPPQEPPSSEPPPPPPPPPPSEEGPPPSGGAAA